MYQVLYRKYRPKRFADVYGQEHVTKTLLHELRENRVSHAYLFTGSRGTGKTTCAKILAKAVNCENSQGGEPCGECEVCRGIDDGSLFDVVEIDAASNNSVNDIRDLREEVNYTPARCKYKVYIIDEVHMLSTGAFNALLKTLEEPPAHVIFILATTEVHKLPATILSRCQRFDFKRIQPETMCRRLQDVAAQEQFVLEDDAAMLIARLADGALRDGLSILDQCAGKGERVTAQLVAETAGLAGNDALYTLSEAVQKQDAAAALDCISSLYANSYDLERLCGELIGHFRNLLVTKTVRSGRSLIVVAPEEYSRLEAGAKAFTAESLLNCLDVLQNTLTAIKSGANARTEMEMTFIRLCSPALDTGAQALLTRVAALEQQILAMQHGLVPKEMPAQPPVQPTSAPKETAEIKEMTEHDPPAPEIRAQMPEQPETQQAPDDLPPWEDTPLPDAPPVQGQPDVQQPAAVSPQPQVQAPAQPPVNQAEPDGDGTVPFARWGELLDQIFETDKALYGVLANSKGYVRGDYFLIDSPTPSFSNFIKTDNHLRNLKQAVLAAAGRSYKIGFFKKAEEKKVQRDPLEDLIARASGNVDLHVDE